MVFEPMLTQCARASNGGVPAAVIHAMCVAHVVPVLLATGGSETQTVCGLLLEAGVLSPNAPYMRSENFNS